MKVLLAIATIGLCLALGACEERLTPPVDTGRPGRLGDTSYVEIYPPWGGFASPRGIIVGRDQILYVADHDSNQVVMIDAGGKILEKRAILHPVAIAQDSRLDLLVAGEVIAPGGADTLGAIIRISLVRYDSVFQSGIRIDTLTQDTIPIFDTIPVFNFGHLATAHMRVVWQEGGRPARRFVGIGVLPGNTYLAVRNGPDNVSSLESDTRVLRFNNRDQFVTPVTDLNTRSGDATGINDIRDVTGIYVFPSSSDFILTQSNAGNAYGAIWMVYTLTAESEGWSPKFLPASVDFVSRSRFARATAATYDGRRREIFIVDSQRDSVVKFDKSGNFKTESFGKSRTVTSQFPGLDTPSGITFASDGTLYVSDTGNRVIRRFKLSGQ